MSLRKQLHALLAHEDLNFLLTNRLPRRWLTRLVGRFSQVEHPWVARASIAVWKYFSDLDLSEARESHFKSMHACFTRALKDGVRPIDPDPLVLSSPVDAIIGAHGKIAGTQVFQAKGFPYTLQDLLGNEEDLSDWRDGSFVTLRLTSSMYHRFHAPYRCTVDRVRYFSGDTWNVNPIALKRVEKLFCKNERAFIRTTLHGAEALEANGLHWCRWRRFWLPASACISWTSCCIWVSGAPRPSPARPPWRRDRRWDGSSMAPP